MATLFRWSWKILSYFVANLSKTLHINFYQNRSSIVEVTIKKFWCVFYASQCIALYTKTWSSYLKVVSAFDRKLLCFLRMCTNLNMVKLSLNVFETLKFSSISCLMKVNDGDARFRELKCYDKSKIIWWTVSDARESVLQIPPLSLPVTYVTGCSLVALVVRRPPTVMLWSQRCAVVRSVGRRLMMFGFGFTFGGFC